MDKEQHQSTPTPEEIWKILREVSEGQKETDRQLEEMITEGREQRKDADRRMKETYEQMREEMKERMKEQMKDTDRRMKETDQLMKENDRLMKETRKQMQKTDERIFGQWGILMESLVEGDLVPLLQAEGIDVRATHTNLHGRLNGEHYEYDIIATNDGEVVVVEVKTTLRPEDVRWFVQKLGRFTSYRKEYRGWQVYGAMAYLKTHETVVKHAERQGLFVIRAVGSSASVVNGTGFRPRVFT